MINKLSKQVELEEESIVLGISRYNKEKQEWQANAPLAREEADSTPGLIVIKRFTVPLSEAIEEWKTEVNAGKARRQALLVTILNQLDSGVIAFLTMRGVVNSMSRSSTLQETTRFIVPAILDEINYKRLKADAPGYAFVLQDTFKKSSSARHRTGVTNNAMTKADIKQIHVDPAERQRLANLLIELTIKTTGMCALKKETVARLKTVLKLKPTPAIQEWFESTHARCELMSPINLPMIVPPKEWTTVDDGGYLSGKIHLKAIKTRNENYLEELKSFEMPEVYKALNAIQDTAWRINTKVLDTMQAVWDSNRTLGKLPLRDDVPLPAKPWDMDTNEEALTLWKRQAARTHEHNNRLVSKRISIAQKLWTATKFKEEDEIYYPHVLDWRGRVYPVAGVGSVNPQGDDTGKALLHFAEGKALGETGGYWLAVHLAGLFGVDKVPFDDRVAWVQEHSFELTLCAQDPLEYQFWTDADKPYQALAAIFEWDMFMTEGDDFVSHLPIAMDGSNNGAQHLSAMGRDDHAAVNLVPKDSPQDIYVDVAAAVSKEVSKLAAEGHEYAIMWEGKITRSLAKRPVMTLCYGATQRGMAGQIEDEVRKAAEAGEPIIEGSELKKPCFWLATIIYPAIGKVTRSAVEIMAWLQKTAKIAASNDLPIRWITPAGFPVLQSYRKQNHMKVESVIAGSRIQLKINEDTGVLDKRRQAAGISPNFVHSLDASHLMLTVNRMKDAGHNSFAMIHDSYGSHAADVDSMNLIIRNTFVEMYTVDILEEFRDQIVEQLPEEMRDQVEPIPLKGNLDLQGILESEFFFS